MSSMSFNDFFTTTEAAAFIGCSDGRVRQLIRDGEIDAEKAGPRMWLISKDEAEKIKKNPAKTGRPRKPKKTD